MKSHSLRLLPNHVRLDDYLVMRGDQRVGRIYKQPAPYPTLEWVWTISGYLELPALQLSGRTGSLEQAKSELTENWKRVIR
jgi:hypothetical protein